MVGSQPLAFSVEVIDKTDWSPNYLAHSSGSGRVLDTICLLFDACPDEIIAKQVLVVDAHRSEVDFLRELRLRLRRMQSARDAESFKKISALPDHRQDAMLIQAADMMAGEIRRLKGEVPNVCVHQVNNYPH
jgi:hypothetical protein